MFYACFTLIGSWEGRVTGILGLMSHMGVRLTHKARNLGRHLLKDDVTMFYTNVVCHVRQCRKV